MHMVQQLHELAPAAGAGHQRLQGSPSSSLHDIKPCMDCLMLLLLLHADTQAPEATGAGRHWQV